MKWLLGQAVKTSPFHGGNTGSIPVGVTRKCKTSEIKNKKVLTNTKAYGKITKLFETNEKFKQFEQFKKFEKT